IPAQRVPARERVHRRDRRSTRDESDDRQNTSNDDGNAAVNDGTSLGFVTVREYLSSLELIGIKLGLDQIQALVALLGHPDRAYRTVVIAGTNGKGSVAAITERGLRAAGYRTGRYTSPHLVDLEERIVIDGTPVDPGQLDATAERVRDLAARLPAPPSFF